MHLQASAALFGTVNAGLYAAAAAGDPLGFAALKGHAGNGGANVNGLGHFLEVDASTSPSDGTLASHQVPQRTRPSHLPRGRKGGRVFFCSCGAPILRLSFIFLAARRR